MSDSTAYGNATPAAGAGVKRGYAYTVGYIYTSEHSISKDIVYSAVVSERED